MKINKIFICNNGSRVGCCTLSQVSSNARISNTLLCSGESAKAMNYNNLKEKNAVCDVVRDL